VAFLRPALRPDPDYGRAHHLKRAARVFVVLV
jgi:hypothetical protein